MIEIPHPWCCQCCKPIEAIEVEFDNCNLGWQIVAYCHGEIDKCFIPRAVMEQRPTIVEAAAFKTKMIEEQAA